MNKHEKLYRDYHNDIFVFLLRLTGYQHSLAEELAQETFYQAILSFHRFKGECEIKSWLCQIAKNLYFNTLRSYKKNKHVLLDESITSPQLISDSVEGDLEEKELLEYSVGIIKKLDEKTRDVMIYRIFSELPYSQISRLLTISESSAKVIYMRGKQKLKKILQEEYGYEI